MATTQQLKNRELAIQNIEQGIPQNTGITDNAIAVDDLTGANDQPFATVQADIQPVSDITDLDTKLPDIPETPQAEKADTLVSRIEELQVGLLGETAFRAEQREDVGISALRTTQEDLASQIEGFKRQSLALENERILAVERIQQESIGRGRTRAGVAPLTAAAQRRITLRQADITSQALTASAALSAVQGRIGTALRLVDEAVAKKFGALKAEKTALIENLNLLISSGTLSREEARRAESQRTRQEEEKRQIEEQEQNELEVQKFAARIAPQLAQLPNGSQLVDAMFNMDSLADANVFAAQIGVFEPQPEILSELDRLRAEKLRAEIRQIGIPKIKEPSPTQRIAAGFAARVADASKIIDEIGDKFTGVVARIGVFLPEGLKTEDRQRFEQAQRNFVNAILRRESGAAIAPSEFASAKLQYFPQPGNKAPVLEQKRQNRELVAKALQLEAGEAFIQLRGELPPVQEKVRIGGVEYVVGTIIQNASGQKARVNSDGTLTFI